MSLKLRHLFETNYRNTGVSNKEFMDEMKKLLNRGEDANAEEGFCLWYTCDSANIRPGIAELLLQAGANPNTQKSDALISSVNRGHLYDTELLLRYGARLAGMSYNPIKNLFHRNIEEGFKAKRLILKFKSKENPITADLQHYLDNMEGSNYDAAIAANTF